MEWLKEQLPTLKTIKSRLNYIFPREIDARGFISRDIGVKTVFVMLYGFCVENMEWLRPVTVTFMTDRQASKKSVIHDSIFDFKALSLYMDEYHKGVI